MFSALLFLFITVPLIEVWILVTVGGILGAAPTVAIIFLTGILGAAMARAEGLKALAKVQQALAEGRLPGSEIVSGLMVLVGGVLLLTPGILTDCLGLACLIPLTREPLARAARTVLGRYVRTQGITFGADATIIDVEGQAERQGWGDEGRYAAHQDRGGQRPRGIVDVSSDER